MQNEGTPAVLEKITVLRERIKSDNAFIRSLIQKIENGLEKLERIESEKEPLPNALQIIGEGFPRKTPHIQEQNT